MSYQAHDPFVYTIPAKESGTVQRVEPSVDERW
jgi:hypothetical protein